MPSPQFKCTLTNSLIADLKRLGSDFGNAQARPQSYYVHYGKSLGPTSFVEYFWRQAERSKSLPFRIDYIEAPYERPDIAIHDRVGLAMQELEKELASETKKKLEVVLNCVDLYGQWVELLKSRQTPAELELKLRAWTQRRVPADCLKDLKLSEIVSQLIDILQRRIGAYTFDQDLLSSWIVPELASALSEVLRPYQPQVNEELAAFIQRKAGEISAALQSNFGIYGLEPREVVNWTLLLVIQDEAIKGQCLKDRAFDILKEQIKLAAFFLCHPQMEMRDQWGLQPEMDRHELKKRRVFLQKFLDDVT